MGLGASFSLDLSSATSPTGGSNCQKTDMRHMQLYTVDEATHLLSPAGEKLFHSHIWKWVRDFLAAILET